MDRADPALAHRARCSSGGERNLPAVVCPVLQLEWKWRHELRLCLVRAVHDDGDARLRRLVRAQSLVSGIRQRPKRWRKPASGETVLGPVPYRAASRARPHTRESRQVRAARTTRPGSAAGSELRWSRATSAATWAAA